jgi:heterodisulfide reductase subunit C
MAVQQAFKVRELMISVLPADVEHETINQDCGYCTTCTTCTNCSNCTSCTSCSYRTTSNQLTEIVKEDDLSLLKQELERLLLK